MAIFQKDPLLPTHAMAMIQPWHPGLMYLINMNVTEDQMILHRIDNQPIPAAKQQQSQPQDALMEMHLSLSMKP